MQDQVLKVVPANQMSLGGQHASTYAQCNGTQKLAVGPVSQDCAGQGALERGMAAHNRGVHKGN